MKFLLYGLNFSPELTGIGKYSGEMAQWLVDHQHDVDVVTAPPYYPEWRIHPGYSGNRYRRETRRHGAQLRITRCPIWIPQKVSGLARLLHLASFAISSLPSFIRCLFARPDVVILVVPTLACAPVVVALAGLAGAKTWLHIQDFEVDAAFNMGILRTNYFTRTVKWLESFFLCRFDRVSSISERMVERVVHKGVPAARTYLLPNWADLSAIKPLHHSSSFRQELELSDEKIVLLYSGNMGEKQGLELLIDVARLAEADSQLVFVLAGDGAARERIRSLSAELKNVRWLPLQPVERLNDLLNLADIHLLPQRADAADLVMPSKLTGMLASGRAVIGTAAADTQLGLVLDAVGVRIEPDDSRAFHFAIRALAADAERRKALGSKGREYAERTMSRDRILQEFVLAAAACSTGQH